MPTTARTVPRTNVGIGNWAITYRTVGDEVMTDTAHGLIALQEWWALVLDPVDRRVIFGVPNVNVISVEPAED